MNNDLTKKMLTRIVESKFKEKGIDPQTDTISSTLAELLCKEIEKMGFTKEEIAETKLIKVI